MSKYPQEFPAVEAKRLYSLATAGQLRDNIIQATHDSWWVAGYLAKYAVGEPGEMTTQADASNSLSMLSEAEKTDLANLAVLAGTTYDDLAQPGEDPGKLLDNIDMKKLLANIQQIISLLIALGIIA